MKLFLQAGTALRLLCLPMALPLLSSCNRSATPTQAKPSEAEELQQDVNAIKNHPSLQSGSNEAGPPLHFDPYPKPRPPEIVNELQHEHEHSNMAKH